VRALFAQAQHWAPESYGESARICGPLLFARNFLRSQQPNHDVSPIAVPAAGAILPRGRSSEVASARRPAASPTACDRGSTRRPSSSPPCRGKTRPGSSGNAPDSLVETTGRIIEPDLHHGESYRDSTNMDRPPVYGTVPAIRFVYRTAAKRPNRQIQSEGWPDRDDEGKLIALARGIGGQCPLRHGWRAEAAGDAKSCVASLAHLPAVARTYVAQDFEVLNLSLNEPPDSANAGLRPTPSAELGAHDSLRS
jgi:hypothetical protein